MNIALSEELEAMVSEQMSSGRYASPTEVLREGLRLLRDEQVRLTALKRDIGDAMAQADQGDLRPTEEVFQRLRQRNVGTRQRP